MEWATGARAMPDALSGPVKRRVERATIIHAMHVRSLVVYPLSFPYDGCHTFNIQIELLLIAATATQASGES